MPRVFDRILDKVVFAHAFDWFASVLHGAQSLISQIKDPHSSPRLKIFLLPVAEEAFFGARPSVALTWRLSSTTNNTVPLIFLKDHFYKHTYFIFTFDAR